MPKFIAIHPVDPHAKAERNMTNSARKVTGAQKSTRLLCLWLVSGIIFLMSISAVAEAKTALLVVGNPASLTGFDSSLKSRLQKYYTVTVADDDAATPDTSKDVIVIATSVNPASVGTDFNGTTKGVVVLKPELLDDMGMVAANAFGSVTAQAIKINVPAYGSGSHQALGAIHNKNPGSNLRVYSSDGTIGWGAPANAATKVTLVPDGTATQATIFAYETGQTMASGAAQGRRIYFFATKNLRADAWRLFDGSADWADGARNPLGVLNPNGISWDSNTILPAGTNQAIGCDLFPNTWAPDDNLYSVYGDCNNVDNTTPGQSMGYMKITGGATAPSLWNVATGVLAPIETPIPYYDDIVDGGGLDSQGSGPTGEKASSTLDIGSPVNKMFVWVRNITTAGERSRLKYNTNYDGTGTWTWATWEFAEFGLPTFVQYGRSYGANTDGYVYIVAHDNKSAYTAADRFLLLRVPKEQVLNRASYQCRNTANSGWTTWTSPDTSTCGAIFTAKGKAMRSRVTYHPGRSKFYWVQTIPNSYDKWWAQGIAVYSAAKPWGPWTTVYYSEHWDQNPGESAEFVSKWLNGADVYMSFSGEDRFKVRHGTLGSNY